MVRTTGTRLPEKGRNMMHLADVRLRKHHGSFQESKTRKWPSTDFSEECASRSPLHGPTNNANGPHTAGHPRPCLRVGLQDAYHADSV